jgi:hypothetical protein
MLTRINNLKLIPILTLLNLSLYKLFRQEFNKKFLIIRPPLIPIFIKCKKLLQLNTNLKLSQALRIDKRNTISKLINLKQISRNIPNDQLNRLKTPALKLMLRKRYHNPG